MRLSRAVWSVNPNSPVPTSVRSQEIYTKSLARTSFTLVMLAIAGGMALLLGVVGIYGVILLFGFAANPRNRHPAWRRARARKN